MTPPHDETKMGNRERAVNIFNSMTTDLCGDIERALDEKDVQAELWKALAGELVDFLDDSEFQADRYLSYETQKVEKLLAKARAIFDDSKQREAGL